MNQTVTNVIELAVGAACLAAAGSSWRRDGAWWLTAFLGLAGLAAIAHAIVTEF